MSINQLLEIGRKSLQAYQAAMNTTGQNIANVETDGYSRRQVDLSSDRTSPGGLNVGVVGREALGTGASVQDIRRVQDRLLSRAHRDATTGHSTAEEEHRLISNLEGVFPTAEGGSLSDQLSAFWNSWEQLANYPSDETVRQGVLGKAQTLATTIRRIDRGIERVRSEAEAEIQSGVDDANELFERIADLNRKISAGSATGAEDLEAKDERDRLLDRLAEKLPVEIQEREHEFAVLVDGKTVVQGDQFGTLEADTSGTTATVSFRGTDVDFDYSDDKSGQIGARLEVVNETIAETQNRLDSLARELVTEVNDLHNHNKPNPGPTSDSFEQDGTTQAGDFFDAGKTAAGSIEVLDAVKADPTKIAASGVSGDAGDNTVALNIAGLRDSQVLSGGTETPGDFAATMLSDIGAKVQSARTRADAESTAADHVAALKEGTEGVSLNEEMTNLIEYQQAFAASARLVQNARQMSETLMSI